MHRRSWGGMDRTEATANACVIPIGATWETMLPQRNPRSQVCAIPKALFFVGVGK